MEALGGIRVEKCRERIHPSRWSHVPGKVNPADIATRFTRDKDLSPSSCWFSGPKFLLCEQEMWPKTAVDVDAISEELKSAISKTSTNVAVVDTSLKNVINIKNYSNFKKLVGIVAYVLRFKHNFIARYLRKQEGRMGDLTVDEMNEAEFLLIKSEQFLIKQDEKFKVLEKSLNLFTDENGIIRLRGR